jgi:hypothetical protein
MDAASDPNITANLERTGPTAGPIHFAAWLLAGYVASGRVGEGRDAMRILAVAAALLTLLTLPAQAQMPGGKHRPSGDDKKDEKKQQVDEKAYKDALKRIPDSKEKYDPWSGARPSTDQKQSR